MPAKHVVVQRAAFAQRDASQPALGGIGRLADRFRHLARLAMTKADAALLIADDHERGKPETPAALHHLGHAVDVDQLVGELAIAFLAAAALPIAPSSSWFVCHKKPILQKLRPPSRAASASALMRP